jgi:hypothetical protein
MGTDDPWFAPFCAVESSFLLRIWGDTSQIEPQCVTTRKGRQAKGPAAVVIARNINY